MSGRSREALEQVRATNRAAMGLSDYVDSPVARQIAGPPVPGPWTGPVVRAAPRPGLAGTVPGMGATFSPLAAIGPVTVGSAFPGVSYTYDPSAPPALDAPSGNGMVADFVTKSIIRPFIRIPSLGWEYNPGASSPDYSGVAAVAVAGAAVAGVGLGGWILVRAFWPRKKAAS